MSLISGEFLLLEFVFLNQRSQFFHDFWLYIWTLDSFDIATHFLRPVIEVYLVFWDLKLLALIQKGVSDLYWKPKLKVKDAALTHILQL